MWDEQKYLMPTSFSFLKLYLAKSGVSFLAIEYCMHLHSWTKLIIFATLLSVCTAITLNFVLQLNVFSCNVIGSNTDDGAPKTWLLYWSTIIPAIATFVMAYVSHKQNKEILIQNKLSNRKLDLQKQYDSFEEFLGKCEDVYSLRRLIAIIECNDEVGPNKIASMNLLNKLDNSVKLKNIQIERFDILLNKYPNFRRDSKILNNEYQNEIMILKRKLEKVWCYYKNGKDEVYSTGLSTIRKETAKLYEDKIKSNYEKLISEGHLILNYLLNEINQN